MATHMSQLTDVQNQLDDRGISLDRVGVTNLYHPLVVLEKSGAQQSVTAAIDLLVGLHEQQRGAHLSSLVEALQARYEEGFRMRDLVELLRGVRAYQDQRGIPFEKAHADVRFKFFLSKAAPASGVRSLMAYDCGFNVTLGVGGAKGQMVEVPISTVCPCSLEISDVGAHNQRALLRIQVWHPLEDERALWLEDVIAIAEKCGSSPVYSVLKRVDEKALTEQMFSAPRFVEDTVRHAVVGVRNSMQGVRYSVQCESFESIHAHNAYAEASGVC